MERPAATCASLPPTAPAAAAADITCCSWKASLALIWARMRAASSARLNGFVT